MADWSGNCSLICFRRSVSLASSSLPLESRVTGMGSKVLWSAVSTICSGVMASVSCTVFVCSGGVSSAAGPPAWDTWSLPICVHTAVMIRKLMVTAIRSMKGTRLTAISSGFLPPLPPLPRSIPPAIATSTQCCCRSRSTFQTTCPRPGSRLLLAVAVRGGDVQVLELVPVGDDEVEHRHAGLVDVVDEVLGAAHQHREGDQR